MKKLFAIVLALALVLSLAACGGNGGSADATKVSVFWYDEADVYLSTVRAELNKALDAAGVAYDNQFAGTGVSKRPRRNFRRRIRRTASSTRDIGTSPSLTSSARSIAN